MTDPSGNNRDPKAPGFSDRLKQAQERQVAKTTRPQTMDGKAMGIGMRLSLELVVATVIGGLLGYAFDWALGTQPWFLIVLVLFGAAAGVRNMLRAMDEMNRAQADASAQTNENTRGDRPSGPQDDEGTGSGG